MRPAPVTIERFELAEGPVWDLGRQRLLWVDIPAGTVLAGRLDGDRLSVESRRQVDPMVAAVACRAGGGLLVAGTRNLVLLAEDGREEGRLPLVPETDARRLNDGACDPTGRYLVGTVSLGDPDTANRLFRLDTNGDVLDIDTDLELSNGIAWSTDGTQLYSVDTLRGVVFVRDYDSESGHVGRRTVHLDTGGKPDGIAVDAEDHLWVAMWGAAEVRRHAPDGALAQSVGIPAPQPTNVTFAGASLTQLVITTATSGMTPRQLEEYPDAGRIFAATVDVPGQTIPSWSPTSSLLARFTERIDPGPEGMS